MGNATSTGVTSISHVPRSNVLNPVKSSRPQMNNAAKISHRVLVVTSWMVRGMISIGEIKKWLQINLQPPGVFKLKF